MKPVKTALTIAGSDPSGGAGIQSDLKTFSRLNVYGMAVIAALTAQNTQGVSSVAEIPPEFLEKQLDAVLSDIPPDAAKTGMLLTAAAVEVVARKVHEHRVKNLVVDPVMISTSGAPLLNAEARDIFRRAILPLAFLVRRTFTRQASSLEIPSKRWKIWRRRRSASMAWERQTFC